MVNSLQKENVSVERLLSFQSAYQQREGREFNSLNPNWKYKTAKHSAIH